ncbi:MAG: cytochrome P450 [Actinomycetota bacterium]
MTYSHLEHANDLEPSVGHHHLLEKCPIHREESFDPPFFVVSRHEDVLSMVTDPGLWQNGDGPGVFHQVGGVLGSADDPDHRRQRKVLQDGFRPATIDALAPRVETIGRELWERSFSADGEGDFVRLFAFPFPAIVIAEMLGVRPEDRDRFGQWSDDIVNGLGGGDLRLVERANEGIHALIDDLVAERRSILESGGEPNDDLVTVLTRALLDGQLSHREVRQLGQQVLVAGHETTASLISLMLYRMITRPELADQLRERPDLIPWAVEEFLRYDSPVQGLFRTNSRTCAVRGVEIEPGTKMQLLFAAANRDPRVWDDPDDIRFDRFGPGSRPHVAFGWGVHHCIGNALARREGQLALRWMIETFDSVELTGEVKVNEPFILRGLTTMPIRWVVR